MTIFEPLLQPKATMRLINSVVLDDDNNRRIVYGIEIVEMTGNEEHRQLICDLSTDKEKLELFLEDLNLGQPDSLHLEYLIEDFISFS